MVTVHNNKSIRGYTMEKITLNGQENTLKATVAATVAYLKKYKDVDAENWQEHEAIEFMAHSIWTFLSKDSPAKQKYETFEAFCEDIDVDEIKDKQDVIIKLAYGKNISELQQVPGDGDAGNEQAGGATG